MWANNNMTSSALSRVLWKIDEKANVWASRMEIVEKHVNELKELKEKILSVANNKSLLEFISISLEDYSDMIFALSSDFETPEFIEDFQDEAQKIVYNTQILTQKNEYLEQETLLIDKLLIAKDIYIKKNLVA